MELLKRVLRISTAREGGQAEKILLEEGEGAEMILGEGEGAEMTLGEGEGEEMKEEGEAQGMDLAKEEEKTKMMPLEEFQQRTMPTLHHWELVEEGEEVASVGGEEGA